MVWHDRHPVLYVMRRADGWHKIGHCFGTAERRVKPIRFSVSSEMRPVTLVHEVPVASSVTVLEVMAHFEMEKMGFQRWDGRGGREWFKASADDCLAAISAAIKRHQEIGDHGWLRERTRRYLQKRKAA